jgi:hypothetical protein
MNVDVGMLEATWAGVWVAGAVGLVGVGIGGWGLWQARAAREQAASANLVAKSALSEAKAANRISREANGISKEANEIARSMADRQIEDHDVDWHCGWESRGVFIVRNNGPHTAYEVRATITVEGVQRVGESERLDPGQQLSLRFEQAAARAASLESARERKASRPPTEVFGSNASGGRPRRGPRRSTTKRTPWGPRVLNVPRPRS